MFSALAERPPGCTHSRSVGGAGFPVGIVFM